MSTAVKALEDWARDNAAAVASSVPDAGTLEKLRAGWLGGTSLNELTGIDEEAPVITRDLYGFQLPWIIHAISQQLRRADEAERADVMAKLALLVEIGVPNEVAARIFLAGVRSRVAATELASLDVEFGTGVAVIARQLRSHELADRLKPLVSSVSEAWLDLLLDDAARGQPRPLPQFAPFTLAGSEGASVLHARRIEDKVFLTVVDGTLRFRVRSTDELPFADVANDPRIAFVRRDHVWHADVRDPRLRGA
jgi:hypothetical protein